MRSVTRIGEQVAGSARPERRVRHPVLISFCDFVFRCEACGVEEPMSEDWSLPEALAMGDAFAIRHKRCEVRDA